jgi:hypothetical protein
LDRVIARFIEETNVAERTNTPLNAFDHCFDSSNVFAWFAAGAGFRCWRIYLCGVKLPVDPLPNGKRHCSDMGTANHHMIWFPHHRVAVDWTSRQFWKDAPHPQRFTKNQLQAAFCKVCWDQDQLLRHLTGPKRNSVDDEDSD